MMSYTTVLFLLSTLLNKVMSLYRTGSLILTLLLLFNQLTRISCSKPPKSCMNVPCGDVNVSYPFALDNRPDCPVFSNSSFFRLHCNESERKLFMNITTSSDGQFDLPSRPVFNATLLKVISITSDSLVIDISSLRANLSVAQPASEFPCGNGSRSRIYLPPFPGPFVISTENQFTSSRCTYASHMTARITYNSSVLPSDSDAYQKYNYSTLESCSCADSCELMDTKCQNVSLEYPKARFAYQSIYDQYYYYSAMTTCSAPGGGFSTFFHPNYTDPAINASSSNYFQIGLKLNWALPSNQATLGIPAIMKSSDYACTPNYSSIKIVYEVPGYLCSCRPGYIGDGYLNGSGCNDTNECTDGTHDCVSGSTCRINQEGNYTCSCDQLFYVGDGRYSGSGCHFPHWLKLAFAISSGIVGFFLIIGGFVYLALWWGQRTKRKYFLQNGGLQMQEYLRMRPGREMTRLFKSEELRAATNNYAEDMKIGEGGFGVVFKGMLNDGRLVAIKKAKIKGSKLDGADSRQFFNEMAILTQINHRHIVQLLGFCLETDTPLLVYEYVSNGNLAENLEAKEGACVILSWEKRLKVARQTAEALAYLHAAASPPILHRDVKSSNVLLDDNLDAKVSDFGLSRLVPDGVKQVSTAVQGTIGYLDPEYFQTLQLTDKSDVYSLGVMLTELITSLKPVDCRNREPSFANLALLFIHRMEEGKLDELMDVRLSAEAAGNNATLRIHSSIIAVAALARQCLALEGRMRPSMSQVVDELRHISRSLEAQGIEDDDEAAQFLSSTEKAGVEPSVGASDVLIESHYHNLDSGSSVDNMKVFNSIMGR